MKLTVIGPWGGYPKVNGASAGYLLEHNGFHLLVDCGSAVLSKLQQYIEPEHLDAAIISHYHPDHIADIGVLQHALIIGKYMNKEIRTLPIYGHNEDNAGFQSLFFDDVTKGMAYDEDQELQIGPFTISFLRTKHPVPCFAMRIEADDQVFVFTADSSYMKSFVSFAQNADILLCESNFYGNMDGSGAGHMTSYEAGELAQAAQVKQLVLTHLPQYGDLNQLKQEAAEKYSGYIQLATEGLIIDLTKN
ncbi:MBL fold metallo-hydrolase [Heyndrickxia sp. FSL K6-6286]|uniref:MBL fold metallo-hydrolase n=1 Tax=Heyndrickxia TaxID=2837504 RepID=UPI0015D10076|nr:MBL fold metallo-hydrolase [Heyndrickxia oleronia]MBU5211827.1 MBL fold metallo-hydrolase [Heyndrickxia oleronia]NYV67703.1 MBL fold metallo-hydrolase [Bacillus sp. Gen3]